MTENLTYYIFKEPATRLSGNKQLNPIIRTHKYVQVAKALLESTIFNSTPSAVQNGVKKSSED